MKRVVVTGLGLLAPGGNDAEQMFVTLTSGRSAIRRLEAPFVEHLGSQYFGQVSFDLDNEFSLSETRALDRVSRLALLAARQAAADASYERARFAGDNFGLYLGIGMGGATSLDESYYSLYHDGVRRLKPYTVLTVMPNATAAWVSMELGLSGPNLVYSTACSSSTVAIGEAYRLIAQGQIPVMFAGGCEAPLSYGQIKAWESLRTLAVESAPAPENACKPFAKGRTGFVLSEGSGIVVLEELEHALARGAAIHAEIVGYATTTDITHITRPSVEGQARTMSSALAAANLRPENIDYINAHGTGTVQNDKVETAAIKEVFGPSAYRVPISSTKSVHGHMLGAAGAVEFIVGLLTLKHQILPPTINLDESDPECDLDYVANNARHVRNVATIMSNSFAFGGTNASLIARRYSG